MLLLLGERRPRLHDRLSAVNTIKSQLLFVFDEGAIMLMTTMSVRVARATADSRAQASNQPIKKRSDERRRVHVADRRRRVGESTRPLWRRRWRRSTLRARVGSKARRAHDGGDGDGDDAFNGACAQRDVRLGGAT